MTGSSESPLTSSVPAPVSGFSAPQIEDSINLMTSAETLKYLPSIAVRERYIGDRNGIVSTRTTGSVSSAESLVYADGLLLSNLLGNSYRYPPRWGLVSPNAIERVEVIYGPFSALYPGNSMGGVVDITTRMPQQSEFHTSITGAQEGFSLYGVDEQNTSTDANVAVGERFGRLALWFDYDRLAAQGHPMSFSTAGLSGKEASASLPRVTGAFRDVDQYGQPRLVFGAYSIDDTRQDKGTLKLSYDITPSLNLRYTLGLWRNDSSTGVQSFLTDTASGEPFFNGQADIGGKAYKVSGLKPGRDDELHRLDAISIGSSTSGVFAWQVSASDYRMRRAHSRAASDYGRSEAGTDRQEDGTGWVTGDFRAVWHPAAPRLEGRHEISFGYHFDRYRLRQTTFDTAEWRNGGDGALNSASRGDTGTQALYLQDAWNILPRWTLTLGGRQEWWQARNGSNTDTSTVPSVVHYPDGSRSAFSPKAALSFDLTSAWKTRLSYGRAVRFPTVSELYQAVTSGQELLQNNPDLQAEDVDAYDWTTQRALDRGSVRFSVFQQNIDDALFSQTDTTISPNLTQIENIDAVRIRGVEAAFHTADVWVHGLDFMGSLTYADSKVLADLHAPAAAGKEWPRIPHWRGRLLATYHQNERLTYSLGYRYSSGAFSRLLNTDVNHGTYGGISPYRVLDAKAGYTLPSGVTISVGIDNITDCKYFVSPHPYPQTTAFINVRYDR